jgi:hypothetical protein
MYFILKSTNLPNLGWGGWSATNMVCRKFFLGGRGVVSPKKGTLRKYSLVFFKKVLADPWLLVT